MSEAWNARQLAALDELIDALEKDRKITRLCGRLKVAIDRRKEKGEYVTDLSAILAELEKAE